jgi:hypothetical protein
MHVAELSDEELSALERVEIPGEAALCDDEMTRLAVWSRHHSPATPVCLGGRWVAQPNRHVPTTGVEFDGLTCRSGGAADNESARAGAGSGPQRNPLPERAPEGLI